MQRNPMSHSIGARKASRRGSVSVFVALALTVLLGFAALAVDYGIMTVTRNHLQRTADAAALAGAAELPASDQTRTDRAYYLAQNTAVQNNVAAAQTTITFPNANRISVAPQRQVDMLFARVLGITQRNVGASAVASRTSLRGVPGSSPLAITTNDYYSYRDGTSFEVELVDQNRQDFRAGTATALDLRDDTSGKTRQVFEDDLTNGYSGTTIFGQPISNSLNADLGPQGTSLQSAVQSRIDRAAGAPWSDNGSSSYTFPNYPTDDPRITTIVVADPHPADNNNPRVTARLLIPVYLERYRAPAGKVTFLRMRILPTKTYSSEDPGIRLGDESTPDTGLSIIRLVD